MAGYVTIHSHEVYFDEASLFIYTEDGCRVKDDPQRPCKHCGIETTIEGHDGCLGTLPGIMNACCGHGNTNHAYIQFECGRRTIREEEALEYITQAIIIRNNNECTNGTS